MQSEPMVKVKALHLLAMLIATTSNMVNRKKLAMGFFTTCTNSPAIGLKSLFLYPYAKCFTPCQMLGSVRLGIRTFHCPDFFYMRLTIGLAIGVYTLFMLLSPSLVVCLITLFILSVIGMVVGFAFLLMSMIIRLSTSTLLLRRLVFHKKAVSYPTRSLLQEQAGSRQLGVIIA